MGKDGEGGGRGVDTVTIAAQISSLIIVGIECKTSNGELSGSSQTGSTVY